MIISNNRIPKLKEFSELVYTANDYLNNDAAKRESYYITRNAQKLEDDVLQALIIASKGTDFQDTIFKISGQKFPDIIAGKYYGVEVKSSKDESWTTLGGSINESTRVEDVERIYLTFGKLVSPIEFKSRPYEDCLSEVVVTHYPRYKINMNTCAGETIFNKMNTTYDELRENKNPVGKIVDYYKSQLKEGERLWWIDNSDNGNTSASIKVRLWKALSKEEKQDFILSGYSFFPSILSNKSSKYNDFSLWLASRYGIVSTSMRDSFSAGGKETITVQKIVCEKIPQTLYKLYENRIEISKRILYADENFLKENWKVNNIHRDRIGQWIDIVSSNYRVDGHNVEQLLNLFFR